jgi:leader peptidase (prepilin peptidase)/N-methyltransferase
MTPINSVRQRLRLLPALTVTPILRWLIAVHSVPDDQPWRSTCTCGRPLWTSATRPSGRCTGCGYRIGAPPYTVEAAAALGLAVLTLSARIGWELAAYAWWTAAMIVLAFVDLAVMRLPHRITIAATAGFLGLLTLTGDAHAWRRAALAGLVVAALFAGLAIATRDKLGWGDVGLAVPVTAALGWHSWQTVYLGIQLGLGAAAIAAITLRRTGRLAPGMPLPLGPFLVVAAAVVLMTS